MQGMMATPLCYTDSVYATLKTCAGLYCYKETCFGSIDCDINALLDDSAETTVVDEATCSWKDDTTATITFESGARDRQY